jgi:hypothetical protein
LTEFGNSKKKFIFDSSQFKVFGIFVSSTGDFEIHGSAGAEKGYLEQFKDTSRPAVAADFRRYRADFLRYRHLARNLVDCNKRQ